MTLGGRIKQLRKKAGLTQSELGKYLKVGKSTISQYETNTNMPDSDMILKIANFFDVSTDYLLGRTNTPRPGKHEDKTEHSPIGFLSQGDINLKELERIINRAVRKALKERENKNGDDT